MTEKFKKCLAEFITKNRELSLFVEGKKFSACF